MTRLIFLATIAAGFLDPGTITFHHPRWSADGRWLVLTANVDGDDDVWIVSRDGSQKQRITDNTVDDSKPDWHPDGRRIVFQRQEGGVVQHFVIDRDGANLRKFDPEAAPPIRNLAVEERQTREGQAVFVSRDGKPGWRISQVAWAGQPSVSRDGVHVVFEQRPDPMAILASEIMVWNVTSESVRPIARGTDPSWAVDGRSIVFEAPGSNGGLFIAIADLVSGRVRTITRGVHPHLSPDGKTMAYIADRPDRADVHVIGVDGRGQACLTCEWR